MTKKTTTTFDIDRPIGKISKSTIFDKIIKEIDAKEIPSKYIDHMFVKYYDGNVVELKGNDLIHPVSLIKEPGNNKGSSFNKMKDIKVFISIDKLETDINSMVEKYLGKHC